MNRNFRISHFYDWKLLICFVLTPPNDLKRILKQTNKQNKQMMEKIMMNSSPDHIKCVANLIAIFIEFNYHFDQLNWLQLFVYIPTCELQIDTAGQPHSTQNRTNTNIQFQTNYSKLIWNVGGFVRIYWTLNVCKFTADP